jgi:hypothetical protein
MNEPKLYIPSNLKTALTLSSGIPIYVMNHRFLTTETNLKALYIFRCLFTTSSVKLFVVNVQIFVYHCVFWKKERKHRPNLSHFENESRFTPGLSGF